MNTETNRKAKRRNGQKQERHSYNPNGLSRKQVALRLKDDEFAHVENMARSEQRSMASMCRMVLLKGLDVIRQEQTA